MLIDEWTTMIDRSGAAFSPCRRYRYRLWRVWDDSLPLCVFVMLNPSTADAMEDDPTIRRCLGFARREGCGGLEVVNLFAWRATDPRELTSAPDPVGPENDAAIQDAASRAGLLIAGWGKDGGILDRDAAVVRLLAGLDVRCLGTNQGGTPRHPLYLTRLQPLERFTMPER